MRKMFVLAIVLMMVAVPAFSNVVVNGDFETGDLTGWTVWAAWGETNAFVSDGAAYDGDYGLQLDLYGTGWPSGSYGVYQVVAVPVGVACDFSAMWSATRNENIGNWSEVLLYDYAVTDINDIDDGEISAPYLVFKRDSWGLGGGIPFGWEAQTAQKTSATGFMTIAFKFGGQGVASMAVDNVSLTPVPEPSSMLALGTGLMGLAGFAIRRRR